MNRTRPHNSVPRILACVACVLALAVLGAGPSLAQDLTPERVQIALEATDRRIEQAAVILAGSDNPAAELELSAARDLQSRARDVFALHQLAFAMRLTFDARRHADRAIALVKGLPDPDRVETQLERTRELLQRTRERVEECDIDRAHGLVRAGVEMQARAEEAALSGRYLVALQLTMGARERAHRALRLCRLEENLQESAERALRRTDEVIARAHEQVDERGNDAARQALARASDLQLQAQQDFRGGFFESSLRHTQSARAFAYRALRLSGSGGRR